MGEGSGFFEGRQRRVWCSFVEQLQLQCSGSRRVANIAWSRGNLSPNPVWSVKIARARVA